MTKTNSPSGKAGGHHRSDLQEQDGRIAAMLSRVRYKLLVMSGKGGVGKSTVAVNLAVALAQAGHKVGLMDIDLHGPSVPTMLGLRNQFLTMEGDQVFPIEYLPGLKVLSIANLVDLENKAVIWRGPIKIGAIRQFLADITWGDLDFLVIDAPPGTGDEPLTVAQTIVGVQSIIITTPQDVALSDVKKSLTFCQKVSMPIMGIVENMSGYVCPKCGHHEDLFSSGGGRKLSAQFDVPFLGSLPIAPDVVKSGDAGRPYLAQDQKSAAAEAFKKIAGRIAELSLASNPVMPGETPVQFISKKAPPAQ